MRSLFFLMGVSLAVFALPCGRACSAEEQASEASDGEEAVKMVGAAREADSPSPRRIHTRRAL